MKRTPVSRVFLVPDEFHLLQYRATIAAVRRRIEAKGLPVRDAFIAFNSSKTGALSCSEMYGALEWLGIRVTPSQVTCCEHVLVACWLIFLFGGGSSGGTFVGVSAVVAVGAVAFSRLGTSQYVDFLEFVMLHVTFGWHAT